jgi:hypothetical protein
MNKYDRSKHHNNFNRSNDIEVSKAFVTKMEALCLAAFLSGNLDAYAVGMNTLAKLQKQDALAADIGALNTQMSVLTKAIEGDTE